MNTLFISVEIFQILRPISLQFIQPVVYVLWFEHILLLTTIRIKIDNQFHIFKSPILMLASTVILLPWFYCIQKSLKKSQCIHIFSNNTNAIVPHMRTLLEFKIKLILCYVTILISRKITLHSNVYKIFNENFAWDSIECSFSGKNDTNLQAQILTKYYMHKRS